MEPLSDGMAATLVLDAAPTLRRGTPLAPAGPSVLDTLVMPMVAPMAPSAPTLPSATARASAPDLEGARPPATSSPPLDAPAVAVVPVVPLFLITFSVVFVIGMVLLLTVAH